MSQVFASSCGGNFDPLKVVVHLPVEVIQCAAQTTVIGVFVCQQFSQGRPEQTSVAARKPKRHLDAPFRHRVTRGTWDAVDQTMETQSAQLVCEAALSPLAGIVPQ